MKFRLLIVILLSCDICTGLVMAQESTTHRTFDETERKRAINGINYQEEKEKNEHHPFDEKERRDVTKNTDYTEDKPAEEAQETTTPTPNIGKISDITKAFLWLFLIVILGVALFLILRLILGDDWFRRKRLSAQAAAEFDIQSIEDNLMEVELTDPIQRAIRDGNYALALRLYYLKTIQTLAQRNHIVWKRHKTNRDYMRELGEKPQSIGFAQVTRQFEDVWYGGTKMTHTSFEQAEQVYKSLQEIA